MDSIKSYGSQGLAFVKANPMTTFGLLVALILTILDKYLLFLSNQLSLYF
jgi:hypothetical protein